MSVQLGSSDTDSGVAVYFARNASCTARLSPIAPW